MFSRMAVRVSQHVYWYKYKSPFRLFAIKYYNNGSVIFDGRKSNNISGRTFSRGWAWAICMLPCVTGNVIVRGKDAFGNKGQRNCE